MLLVVFGAGASSDALPDYPRPEEYSDRLPLTSELFDVRFASELGQFRRATGIAPFLRNLGSGVSLESRLQELIAEGGDERVRELMAVRFYLQFMLSGVDKRWNERAQGVTNYRTLLGDVLQLTPPHEPVVLATFNYDRMLEWSLADLGVSIDDLSEYTSGRIKLFKLHGSVNWARMVSIPRLDQLADPGGWNPSRFVIESAPQVKLTGGHTISEARPIQVVDSALAVPALALPLVENKAFELPREHRQELDRLMPEVTKVLFIGWKAADGHFRQMLKRIRSASGLVVSPNNPEEAKERLAECRTVRLETQTATFTEFAVGRHVRTLLA